MPKVVRFAGWGLAGLLVLVLVAGLGLRFYLASDGVKRLAAGKLSALLGEPVVVKELDAGLVGSTTVVLEVPAVSTTPNAPAPAEPMLSGRVAVDVSAVGLAAGRSPSSVTVEDAKLTLRFDRAGKLLDKLPDPKGGGGDTAVPEVVLKRASVHLIQEGRPDFRVTGLDATLKPDGDRLTVAGRADDPTWGKWTLAGGLAKDGATGDVTLTTDAPAHLGMAQLRSLPVVSPAAWRAVELDGDSTGTIKVNRPAGGDWAYHIDLEPRNTTLTLPPVGVTVTDATAKIGIEGLVVTVKGLKGKVAGGDVTADGVGDFAPVPEVVNLKIGVTGADVNKLPEKWVAKLKQVVGPVDDGRLRAAGDLTLKIKGEDVEPHGSGKGTVTGKLLGGTVELRVSLVGTGKTVEVQGAGG